MIFSFRRWLWVFIVPLCLCLSSCSVFRPTLITDAKERICNRSGDRKEVGTVYFTNAAIIESSNWQFDSAGRVFVEVFVWAAEAGNYELALDFHEPFEDLRFVSPVNIERAGQKEMFRIGPLPYAFARPSFAEVSLMLFKSDAQGKPALIDEADTYFLLDADHVNADALSGMNTSGLTAQEILDQYAPVLKTDIIVNAHTGIVFFDLPPKDIAAILSGPPQKGGAEQAMIKCDLWTDRVLAEAPTAANRREFNGRKDDYFIDLVQPFESIDHPWREIVNRYPCAMYGRIVRTPLVWNGVTYPQALVLQYWMPYYVNHLSILKTDKKGRSWIWNAGNYHEGEAENIAVVLIPSGEGLKPLGAAYAKHFKGTAEPWSNVRKHAPEGIPTRHPVVYVANGSHASFFSPDPNETSCGSGIDAGMHTGGGFWYTPVDFGRVKMMPPVHQIRFGSEFDFLLFTGRFGGSYIKGAVNQFNRSPYMFPYVFYPRFSITGNWIAGSGVNRWIDPASEIRYQAKIPSKLSYDNRNARLMFDVASVRIKKEPEGISIENLKLIFERTGPSPATRLAIFYRDSRGRLQKLASFPAGDNPPLVLHIPADDARQKAIELVACDLVAPMPPKPPFRRELHERFFETFLTTSTILVVP